MDVKELPKIVSIVESIDAFGVGKSIVYLDDKYEMDLYTGEARWGYISALSSLGVSSRNITIEHEGDWKTISDWGTQVNHESLRCLLQSARLSNLDISIS
jgi:hypothetical protein